MPLERGPQVDLRLNGLYFSCLYMYRFRRGLGRGYQYSTLIMGGGGGGGRVQILTSKRGAAFFCA